MKAKLFPLATALFGAIAGCKVGPDYKPPEITTPAVFSQAPTTQPSTQPSTRPSVSTQWWKSFNDPKLDRLIESAVAANLDLRIATARIREARALRKVAAADLFPTVDTSGSY